MKKNESCCSCGADFQKEVKGLVNEVEGYSEADRTKKAKEVEAAFKETKPASKTAAKK